MIVIFDLDGTLADITHRRHLVEGENKDWDKFYAECVNDKPNTAVIHLFDLLQKALHTMIIFSGRCEVVRKQTYEWLRKNNIKPDILFMREEGDFTPDNELKAKWLKVMNNNDILCVFDDRQKVVDMWRSKGLKCFQVDAGDF